MWGGIGSVLSGLFGSGGGYDNAGKAYNQAFNQAQRYQQPFYNAGQQAIPQYQDWANKMQDPTKFINDTMGQYQESPWAKFQTQQALRAANNAASASGMIGSTPAAQANADYARNISSQDMQQWLNQVLGINSQYGGAQGNLMNMGQNIANNMSNNAMNHGKNMGQIGYNQGEANQRDWGNIFGGIGNIFSSFF